METYPVICERFLTVPDSLLRMQRTAYNIKQDKRKQQEEDDPANNRARLFHALVKDSRSIFFKHVRKARQDAAVNKTDLSIPPRVITFPIDAVHISNTDRHRASIPSCFSRETASCIGENGSRSCLVYMCRGRDEASDGIASLRRVNFLLPSHE